MMNMKLRGENLLTLQKERGNICVSVIVPTHRLSPQRRVDKPAVEKAVKRAKQQLEYRYGTSSIKPLFHSLDELSGAIDFSHNAEGIGMYVSPNIQLLVHFPFAVKEKVMVGDNFELRDMLYQTIYSVPYYVLLLTEKEVKLFEGSLRELTEIKDSRFPKKYQEEYLYEKPSRSTSYSGYAHVKSFEKDKSEAEEIRYKDFFRDVDKDLRDYITGAAPVILLGPEKELSWFEKISMLQKRVIGKISGSYGYNSLASVADLAWPVMHDYLQQESQNLIKDFEERIGEHRGISSIQEVWRAAKEGRALKLLVEKDFRCPGFVEANDDHLFLQPPKAPHRVLADAVDELIEIVLQKNGTVFFVDDGALSDYGHVALITRY